MGAIALFIAIAATLAATYLFQSLCNSRFGKPGYFEDKTLDGLQKQFDDLVREALSRTLFH